jgi:hypothetical protein
MLYKLKNETCQNRMDVVYQLLLVVFIFHVAAYVLVSYKQPPLQVSKT